MTESISWVAPDNTVTVLDVEWDARGRFMPSMVYRADPVPGRAGEVFREVRHGTHEFTLPVWLIAADEPTLRTVVRSFVASMDPTRGLGKIRVTSPIGDVRDINCRYAGGLEMDETLSTSGETWQKAAVSFIAHDPYWYDPSPTELSFTVTDTPDFFPFLPVRLTSSELVADGTVTNGGDVDAWPVWTITGPGSDITLRNMTTGKFLTLDSISLDTGESATIDTRPGYRTITQQDGTNLYPSMTLFSSLWPLVLGANNVRLEMTGVDAAMSELSLSYYQRYLSP